MSVNKKNLIIRIDQELLDVYRSLCKKMGFNMSQKIRNFIHDEIKKASSLHSQSRC